MQSISSISQLSSGPKSDGLPAKRHRGKRERARCLLLQTKILFLAFLLLFRAAFSGGHRYRPYKGHFFINIENSEYLYLGRQGYTT